jgi:phage terminase large subunit
MIVAPTYRMLEDVTVAAFTETLERHNRPYNRVRSRQLIETGNGKVFTRSAEHPDRLRGPNLSWALIDEAALCRDTVWPIMLGRLRLNSAVALVTTTPSGYNWLYHYWVEMQNESYGMVQCSTRENYHLDADFVGELEASYTDQFAAQEIDGQFVTFEGLIYTEFSHDAEIGNIQEVEIQDDWTKVRGIDFGYTNPFVCLWGAVDGDGRLHIYNEHYERKRLIKDHACIIKDTETASYLWTVADWDAQERAELESEGISTSRAQKEVTLGIQKVKARLKRQADGKPRLTIHPRCVNTIKEFSSYRWNPNAKGGKEEPLKEFDHAMDVVRYMTMEFDNSGFVLV